MSEWCALRAPDRRSPSDHRVEPTYAPKSSLAASAARCTRPPSSSRPRLSRPRSGTAHRSGPTSAPPSTPHRASIGGDLHDSRCLDLHRMRDGRLVAPDAPFAGSSLGGFGDDLRSHECTMLWRTPPARRIRRRCPLIGSRGDRFGTGVRPDSGRLGRLWGRPQGLRPPARQRRWV